MTASAAPRLEFTTQDMRHRLVLGQSFGQDKDHLYRDTPTERLARLNERIRAGALWKDAVRSEYQAESPWLCDIVTADERTIFFRRFPPPRGSLVLDIGAGWGQTAIPLAAAAHVAAIEPTPERLDFIKAVASQEGVAHRMWFLRADYLDLHFHARFDLAILNGVLEWVGAFSDDADPRQTQRRVLRKACEELADNGRLVIGIENRLGLKYLLGAKDDHIGAAGVAVLDFELAAQRWMEGAGKVLRTATYTQTELEALLRQAGFDAVAFHYAFPDYKLSRKIFGTPDEVNRFFLQGGYVEEHDGTNGQRLECQEELRSHYRSLAAMGVAHLFAPSYFVEAAKNPTTPAS